jgi:uncharacterized protein YozE (UPF0346 family)
MFDFAKQTKQFEDLAARIKDMNDFWVNIVMSTWKEIYEPKKK